MTNCAFLNSCHKNSFSGLKYRLSEKVFGLRPNLNEVIHRITATTLCRDL